ncbi:hypothetical protein [Kitasatospora viridis]|uniref:Uncharacterized protein n=1 Tax=Kitasatospora viridis TaxID=281105 RepID=A0A561SA47_9ACTN|nr:hypothetical protein [Kitasatospora viridis]TWF71675.1 hypothetical protein FHX73_1846 [Kitasatospora viridis]
MSDDQMSTGALWELIQKDAEQTRRQIHEVLTDVRERLDSFLTREQWSAEKALLELRLGRAEQELAEQDRKRAALEERVRREHVEQLRREEQRREVAHQRRMNVWFKVVIPVSAIIVPVLVALWSPLGK